MEDQRKRSIAWRFFSLRGMVANCQFCPKKYQQSHNGFHTTQMLRHVKARHPEKLDSDQLLSSSHSAAPLPGPNISTLGVARMVEEREKRSIVWQFFTLRGMAAACHFCPKKFKHPSGSPTSHLFRHVKARHPEKLNGDQSLSSSHSAAPLPGPSARPSAPPRESAALTNDPWASADRQLASLIAVSGLPADFVSSPHFKAFCGELSPSYVLPGKERVTRITAAMAAEHRHKLSRRLASAEEVALSVDFWPASAFDEASIATLSVHFFTGPSDDAERASFLLDLTQICDEGLSIQQMIEDCCMVYGIQKKIVCIVSNFTNAAVSYAGIERCECGTSLLSQQLSGLVPLIEDDPQLRLAAPTLLAPFDELVQSLCDSRAQASTVLAAHMVAQQAFDRLASATEERRREEGERRLYSLVSPRQEAVAAKLLSCPFLRRALLLDPRFAFLELVLPAKEWEDILKEFCEFAGEKKKLKSSSGEAIVKQKVDDSFVAGNSGLPSSSSSSASIWDIFTRKSSDLSTSMESPLRIELSVYRAQCASSRPRALSCPREWWRARRSTLPTLHAMQRRYAVVPASAASSAGAALLTKRTTRLSTLHNTLMVAAASQPAPAINDLLDSERFLWRCLLSPATPHSRVLGEDTRRERKRNVVMDEENEVESEVEEENEVEGEVEEENEVEREVEEDEEVDDDWIETVNDEDGSEIY